MFSFQSIKVILKGYCKHRELFHVTSALYTIKKENINRLDYLKLHCENKGEILNKRGNYYTYTSKSLNITLPSSRYWKGE